ncbi:alpha-ketoacid dehydrogenase subunit beta [Candidatus Poriferisocius sp.]|uniref:alpha-ketoacid dehydrogenase subunit beta n=1 Tax=Candidatus Poriferisocius sp. TaxID=3101276 RepID=UPI003B5A0822
MRMNQAISVAIADEMRANPDVIVLGEDVAVAEGPFKTSEGLLEEFGPLRVRDTPISEMGFLGAAVGAAATGLRPVVEIMFVEFLGVALDQLSTEGAKFHYLSGGRVTVPLTVRASVGAGLGFGTQHSQTLESWVLGTPGLRLAVASGPANAYGLMRAAIRDDNPTVVLEPRRLYARREPVTTGEEGILPLGVARRVAEGGDATVVALGSMVGAALEAAEAAPWSADVIDLQSLQPWDRDAVCASVARTGRLVTVEENPLTGGWGADIVAAVVAEVFDDLEAPPLRITAPDVPVPFGKELEERYMPSPTYIGEQVFRLLDSGQVPPPWWEGRVTA